jgi:hypothetical protein
MFNSEMFLAYMEYKLWCQEADIPTEYVMSFSEFNTL